MNYSISETDTFLKSNTIKNWVHQYLADDGNNSRLSWELVNRKTFFLGPKILPLNKIIRTCGIGKEEYTENVQIWNRKISYLRNVFSSGQCLGPLMVRYECGDYHLYDGNHRHFVLQDAGVLKYPCIIIYHEFSELFGDNLFSPKNFLFTISDNEASGSRQIDLLAVLLRKEFPDFEIRKIESILDANTALNIRDPSKALILLKNQDIDFVGSEECVKLSLQMSDVRNGFEIVDSIIDCIIGNCFV